MKLKLQEVVRLMRENGIKRAVLLAGVELEERTAENNGARLEAFTEIELSDTIPAPAPVDWADSDGKGDDVPWSPPAEQKAPGQCIGVGCSERGGWHGTGYCRAHGLSAAGVKS